MNAVCFFVTGSDTGVGKTLACCALLHAARRDGLSTLGLKPLAAGGERVGGQLRNGDALLLQRHSSRQLDYDAINPVALAAPIAPHLAATDAGLQLDAGTLATHCQRTLDAERVELALIEGAGGWRVPLSDDETMAELAQALGYPVILVVAMRLGCLNHALLTAEAIAGDGLRLAGWIANSPGGEPMPRLADNVETLRQRLPAPCLGVIPPLSSPAPEAAAAQLSLTALLGATTAARPPAHGGQ